jgi:hypothetical protein
VLLQEINPVHASLEARLVKRVREGQKCGGIDALMGAQQAAAFVQMDNERVSAFCSHQCEQKERA